MTVLRNIQSTTLSCIVCENYISKDDPYIFIMSARIQAEFIKTIEVVRCRTYTDSIFHIINHRSNIRIYNSSSVLSITECLSVCFVCRICKSIGILH